MLTRLLKSVWASERMREGERRECEVSDLVNEWEVVGGGRVTFICGRDRRRMEIGQKKISCSNFYSPNWIRVYGAVFYFGVVLEMTNITKINFFWFFESLQNAHFSWRFLHKNNICTQTTFSSQKKCKSTFTSHVKNNSFLLILSEHPSQPMSSVASVSLYSWCSRSNRGLWLVSCSRHFKGLLWRLVRPRQGHVDRDDFECSKPCRIHLKQYGKGRRVDSTSL